MPDPVSIIVNGETVRADSGVSVAAMLLTLGGPTCRRAADAGPRGPLCGMGICFECRVTINGVPDRRACMTWVSPGMRVDTDG